MDPGVPLFTGFNHPLAVLERVEGQGVKPVLGERVQAGGDDLSIPAEAGVKDHEFAPRRGLVGLGADEVDGDAVINPEGFHGTGVREVGDFLTTLRM